MLKIAFGMTLGFFMISGILAIAYKIHEKREEKKMVKQMKEAYICKKCGEAKTDEE